MVQFQCPIYNNSDTTILLIPTLVRNYYKSKNPFATNFSITHCVAIEIGCCKFTEMPYGVITLAVTGTGERFSVAPPPPNWYAPGGEIRNSVSSQPPPWAYENRYA